jgi:hypothetical protein
VAAAGAAGSASGVADIIRFQDPEVRTLQGPGRGCKECLLVGGAGWDVCRHRKCIQPIHPPSKVRVMELASTCWAQTGGGESFAPKANLGSEGLCSPLAPLCCAVLLA